MAILSSVRTVCMTIDRRMRERWRRDRSERMRHSHWRAPLRGKTKAKPSSSYMQMQTFTIIIIIVIRIIIISSPIRLPSLHHIDGGRRCHRTPRRRTTSNDTRMKIHVPFENACQVYLMHALHTVSNERAHSYTQYTLHRSRTHKQKCKH